MAVAGVGSSDWRTEGLEGSTTFMKLELLRPLRPTGASTRAVPMCTARGFHRTAAACIKRRQLLYHPPDPGVYRMPAVLEDFHVSPDGRYKRQQIGARS